MLTDGAGTVTLTTDPDGIGTVFASPNIDAHEKLREMGLTSALLAGPCYELVLEGLDPTKPRIAVVVPDLQARRQDPRRPGSRPRWERARCED